jgi:hypothetical protein
LGPSRAFLSLASSFEADQMSLSAWAPRFYPCMIVPLHTDCTVALYRHLPTIAAHNGSVPYCVVTTSACHPHGTLLQCSSALFGSSTDPSFPHGTQNTNRRRTRLKWRDPFYLGSSSAEEETRAALKPPVQSERAATSGSTDETRSNHEGNSRLLTLNDVKETAKAR